MTGPSPPKAAERPDSWPERLRAVASWLDLTDPIMAAVMQLPQFRNDPNLPEALECVAGGDMQNDLRTLADILEELELAEVADV